MSKERPSGGLWNTPAPTKPVFADLLPPDPDELRRVLEEVAENFKRDEKQIEQFRRSLHQCNCPCPWCPGKRY